MFFSLVFNVLDVFRMTQPAPWMVNVTTATKPNMIVNQSMMP